MQQTADGIRVSESLFPAASSFSTEATPSVRPKYQRYGFRFHGSASEYFGIWMVNLMLTIVTLTLYSPWVKARRMRYFYGNTQFLKHRFDFVAMPSRILLGRLFALELYLVTVVLTNYSILATSSLLMVAALCLPWLIRMTLKFKARNSKYGNVRFYFNGSNREAYRVLFLAILINIFTLLLFSPVMIWLYKRYCFNHLSIGQLQFKLNINWSKFMSAVYLPFGLCLLVGIGWLAAVVYWVDRIGTNLFSLGLLLSYLLCLALVWPVISARLYLITWNHVELGQSYFKTRVTTWRYSWIVLSNWIVRVLSLGLMTPWAAIRLYEYQLKHLELYVVDDETDLKHILQPDPSALADEILDVFDFDASL